jgi:histidinol-phosphatase
VLDVAVDPVANAWDLAALVPVLAEAGGRLTGLSGGGTFAEGDGIASNGRLHDAALAQIGTRS